MRQNDTQHYTGISDPSWKKKDEQYLVLITECKVMQMCTSVLYYMGKWKFQAQATLVFYL